MRILISSTNMSCIKSSTFFINKKVIYGPFCGIKCQKTNNGNLKSHLPKKPDMIKKYITNFNEKTHFAKSNYDNFAVTVTII